MDKASSKRLALAGCLRGDCPVTHYSKDINMNYAVIQDTLFWMVALLVAIAAITYVVYILLAPAPTNQPATKKSISKAIRLYPQVEALVWKRLDSGEVLTNSDLDKIVEEVSLNSWKKSTIDRQRQDINEVSRSK